MTLSRLFAAFVFALTTAVSLASPTHAQVSPVLTISNGVARGEGGFHYDRKQFTLDGMFGVRAKNNSRISTIVGVYGGSAWSFDDDALPVCEYNASPTRPLACPQGFPGFRYLGLAVGAETRKKYVGLTLTGGPGAFRSEERGTESTILGLMAKADVNFYVGEHFQWVVSGSTRHVANYQGSGLFVNAFSLGIRVQ